MFIFKDEEMKNIIFIITEGLIHNQNVILLTPCGSGKSLIFKMGVCILKKIKKVDNGIGICLEPLNNILSEKTSNKNCSFKSAYLTMTGEDIKNGDASLSLSREEIARGDILYLYGHPESFLSSKG